MFGAMGKRDTVIQTATEQVTAGVRAHIMRN